MIAFRYDIGLYLNGISLMLRVWLFKCQNVITVDVVDLIFILSWQLLDIMYIYAIWLYWSDMLKLNSCGMLVHMCLHSCLHLPYIACAYGKIICIRSLHFFIKKYCLVLLACLHVILALVTLIMLCIILDSTLPLGFQVSLALDSRLGT